MKSNSNLVLKFKFVKLDIFLKIKPDSGSLCNDENYENYAVKQIQKVKTIILLWNIFDGA